LRISNRFGAMDETFAAHEKSHWRRATGAPPAPYFDHSKVDAADGLKVYVR
jgi:hypothetical protein